MLIGCSDRRGCLVGNRAQRTVVQSLVEDWTDHFRQGERCVDGRIQRLPPRSGQISRCMRAPSRGNLPRWEASVF